ncbi:MAG TPA: FAD-dependent oxidoreductase [Burkholderiaceae bacterium]|nr:FAD-dependent oxidoreductase [Burkholderiaceae bacterium]
MEVAAQDPGVDVIVVGSGVAGMTAAIVAACQGLKVIVLEKSDLVGGTTAFSAGAAWLPGCKHVPHEAGGITAAYDYVANLMGERMEPELVRAYLQHGTAALEYLEKHTCVQFRLFQGADYRTDVAGASTAGRTVDPVPFDDRRLGKLHKLIRPPMPWMTLFHGMQTDNDDVRHLLNALHSPKSLLISARRILKHYADLALHGRSTRRVRGSALVAMLLRAAVDRGVEVRTGAACQRLLSGERRISGVEFLQGGQLHTLLARRAVVLAAGGFSANAQMRQSHAASPALHRGLPPATNVGDGVRMAGAAGAELGKDNFSDYCLTPVSCYTQSNGEELRFPHFLQDRCKPGAIAVGASGRRFVNEGCSYHDFTLAMQRAGAVPAFLIADHAFVRKYGLGMARPFPFPIRSFLRNGYLTRAATLQQLAAALGIDGEALEATVGRVNDMAQTGIDLEFGKGHDAYSRSHGDPRHGPNPCLGPIGRGPFYAIRLYPGDTGTTCGLVANASAQVLDSQRQPIEGLYACGMDMNNPTKGVHPSSGCNIGPAMAFGYIAAMHIATTLRARSEMA